MIRVSTKDKNRDAFKSFVVCASCNACYKGETTKHLTTRIKEHLWSDKRSHIYKHLCLCRSCKHGSSANYVSMFDTAKTKCSLKDKGAIYIKWHKPDLNKQIKCLNTTICV